MADEDPGLELERQMRRERNAAREAERVRAEYLASLSEEDRAALLAEEDRKGEEARAAAARQEQRALESWEAEQRREAALYAERQRHEAARFADEAPSRVVAAWESVRGHTLSDERRAAFLARDEIAGLGRYGHKDLVLAAEMVMVEHGELLLSHWLAEVRAREAKADARDRLPEWKKR